MNRRHWFHRIAVLTAVVVGFQGVAVAGISAPVDLLPDVRVARLYGFDLEYRPGGQTRLHFGTIGYNVGDGPLEARGSRNDTDEPVMSVVQRIYNSDGGYRQVAVPATMIYETGDSHDHWHTRQFMTVRMHKKGAPNREVHALRKLGYCLLDARRMPNPPPGSPATRSYPNGSCGNSTSLTVRTGLSIGYGDDYPPHYAHQWMNVTGLPPGIYRICTTVDALDDFFEKKEANNQRWTDVEIDLAARRLDVLASSGGSCKRSV